MGGVFGYNGKMGNVIFFVEVNIIGDFYVVDEVFRVDWFVIVVGLDVIIKMIMSNVYLYGL